MYPHKKLVNMPTVVRVSQDDVINMSPDGRGIVHILPLKCNNPFRPEITFEFRERLEHVVIGTLLVSHVATLLGVVYETRETPTGVEAKFWPLSFTGSVSDLHTLMTFLFEYKLGEIEKCEEAREIKVLDWVSRGCGGSQPHPFLLGYMKIDIPPRERATLLHIPGRDTPVIDCDHIRSTKPEETLADECLKQLSKMLLVGLGNH